MPNSHTLQKLLKQPHKSTFWKNAEEWFKFEQGKKAAKRVQIRAFLKKSLNNSKNQRF